MAKSLNIKDPEAYQLARELAQRTGESVTRTVVQALRDRLERMRGVDRSVDLIAQMETISRRIRGLSVLDTRTADEILGYNNHGIFD